MITEKKGLFKEVTVNGNKELDYLDSLTKELVQVEQLATTDTIRISETVKYRPDLLSLKYYGTYHLGWLIALHNNFLDPIFDFEVGVLVRIPSIEQYQRFYTREVEV
jgi:hypothetical protein